MLKKVFDLATRKIRFGNFFQLKVPNQVLSDIIYGYDCSDEEPVGGHERSDDLEKD